VSPPRRQATLAQQAGGRVMEGPEGQSETRIGRSWRRGLVLELLVGIVLSVILAVAVALAGGTMTTAPEPATGPVIVPVIEDESRDLDPRDPLVRCETFETHTRCIREES
jgi:hypothetical protein